MVSGAKTRSGRIGACRPQAERGRATPPHEPPARLRADRAGRVRWGWLLHRSRGSEPRAAASAASRTGQAGAPSAQGFRQSCRSRARMTFSRRLLGALACASRPARSPPPSRRRRRPASTSPISPTTATRTSRLRATCPASPATRRRRGRTWTSPAPRWCARSPSGHAARRDARHRAAEVPPVRGQGERARDEGAAHAHRRPHVDGHAAGVRRRRRRPWPAPRGKGVTYEIWNEEDDTTFWANGPQPAAYTALLKAAYPAIKSRRPRRQGARRRPRRQRLRVPRGALRQRRPGLLRRRRRPHRHRVPDHRPARVLPRAVGAHRPLLLHRLPRGARARWSTTATTSRSG